MAQCNERGKKTSEAVEVFSEFTFHSLAYTLCAWLALLSAAHSALAHKDQPDSTQHTAAWTLWKTAWTDQFEVYSYNMTCSTGLIFCKVLQLKILLENPLGA